MADDGQTERGVTKGENVKVGRNKILAPKWGDVKQNRNDERRHSRRIHRSGASSLNNCSSLTLGATLSRILHTSCVWSKADIPNNRSMFIIAPIVGPSPPRAFGCTTADCIGERQADNNERGRRFPIFAGEGNEDSKDPNYPPS